MDYSKRFDAKTNIDDKAQCFYHMVYGKNDSFCPHCHDYYEIFITISGTVHHWINGETIFLPEGSMVFIRPDDVHGYVYDNNESIKTVYINLTFTRETAKQLFDYFSEGFPSHELLTCSMPPYVVLTAVEKRELFSKISQLNTVHWQDKEKLKFRMRALLANIFSTYFSGFTQKSDFSIPMWLTRLIDKMNVYENFIGGNEKMLFLSGKSREHLARSMKKYYGLTVSEYINDLKLNYAVNLLLNTNSEIIDICYQAGFQNVSWFYNLFKKKYNMSPKQFREVYKYNSMK